MNVNVGGGTVDPTPGGIKVQLGPRPPPRRYLKEERQDPATHRKSGQKKAPGIPAWGRRAGLAGQQRGEEVDGGKAMYVPWEPGQRSAGDWSGRQLPRPAAHGTEIG